jgi:hypothetical protein
MPSSVARRVASAGSAVVAGTACWLAGAAPATAAAQGCPTGYFVDITSHSSYHIRGRALPIYKDGPGGDVTGTVGTATTVTATITAGFSAELGGVIARAKAEVSASLTREVGVTVGHSYHRDITPGKYGNMQYGSWGQKVTWKKYHDNGTCTTSLVASGTAYIPVNSVGWKYWETSS